MKSKSLKLSKTEKSHICNAILGKSIYAKVTADNAVVRNKLAIDIRDWTLGRNKSDYLALPKKLQRIHGFINVSGFAGNNWLKLNFAQREACPVETVIYDGLTKKLKQRIEKSSDDAKLNSENERVLRNNVNNMLEICSTTGRLEELFVGVQQYYSECLTNRLGGNTLPALTMSIKDIKSKIK